MIPNEEDLLGYSPALLARFAVALAGHVTVFVDDPLALQIIRDTEAWALNQSVEPVRYAHKLHLRISGDSPRTQTLSVEVLMCAANVTFWEKPHKQAAAVVKLVDQLARELPDGPMRQKLASAISTEVHSLMKLQPKGSYETC